MISNLDVEHNSMKTHFESLRSSQNILCSIRERLDYRRIFDQSEKEPRWPPEMVVYHQIVITPRFFEGFESNLIGT